MSQSIYGTPSRQGAGTFPSGPGDQFPSATRLWCMWTDASQAPPPTLERPPCSLCTQEEEGERSQAKREGGACRRNAITCPSQNVPLRATAVGFLRQVVSRHGTVGRAVPARPPHRRCNCTQQPEVTSAPPSPARRRSARTCRPPWSGSRPCRRGRPAWSSRRW